MVISIIEYGEVRVFDDIQQAMDGWRSYPSDIANEVVVFYDADGTWLEPILTPGSRRWFGLLKGHDTFTFQRKAITNGSIDPIELALFEASNLLPNHHFSSLDEMRVKFPFVQGKLKDRNIK